MGIARTFIHSYLADKNGGGAVVILLCLLTTTTKGRPQRRTIYHYSSVIRQLCLRTCFKFPVTGRGSAFIYSTIHITFLLLTDQFFIQD